MTNIFTYTYTNLPITKILKNYSKKYTTIKTIKENQKHFI